MQIVLNGVEIIDKRSTFHRKKRNVLIKKGIIEKITEKKISSAKSLSCQGSYLSIGWFDLWASFKDPGEEYKEDLNSGTAAAASGGFTEVGLLPTTKPSIQTKNDIHYIKSKNTGQLTQIHPYAAVTLDNRGEELTEMLDLHHAGAVAFTDGENPIWHSHLLLKALQYLQKTQSLLINRPQDKMLTVAGVMNEGIQSTRLGMKGMPGLAEELMIARDLKVLEYAGGRMHFANLSTGEGVDLIRKAKRSGLKVTCDVAAHQLMLKDEALVQFDTNYKVDPPLRTSQEINALIKGLKDGTIDAITSSHFPQDEEAKKLEFDQAEFGIIGLQTVLPILVSLQSKVPLDVLVEKVSSAPRRLLNLEIPELKEGHPANLCLFDTRTTWTFDEKSNLSKSRNSPYFNTELRGKVKAVFNRGQAQLFD